MSGVNERESRRRPRDSNDSRSSRSAMVSLHTAALLFGFAGLFGKWLSLPPATIVLGRTVVASAALALMLRLLREPVGAFEWRLAAGGAVLALHWVAFFHAIQISSVAVGLLGFASFPLFVLALEAWLLARPLHAAEWAIGVLVVAGLMLIVPEFSTDNHIVRGLLWGVLSGFTFALLAVGNRSLAARRAPSEIALWQNACAAACLLPGFALQPIVPTMREAALLVALGVLCTALAHTLYIRGMRVVSALTASVIAALDPVYGIALAFVLLDEVPGARTLAGAALIVAAALLATWRKA